MYNGKPYEIIAAPFTLYVAPAGTAFPDVDETPGAGWTKVGTSGDLNYMEDGVKVRHTQSISFWRALGDGAPRKAFRSQEGIEISMVLADVSLEQYSQALNGNTVAEVEAAPGVPGTKTIGLSRGLELPEYALLVRGPSPYGDGLAAQYEVPVAVQTGEPELVFRKADPAGLALSWGGLIDPDASSPSERFGRLVAQTEEAGT